MTPADANATLRTVPGARVLSSARGNRACAHPRIRPCVGHGPATLGPGQAELEAGPRFPLPGYRNSTAVADPRLGFLGDVFAIPASWPLSNVFSVGDVLIAVGAVWGLHRVCGSRLAGPARPRRP
jgi:hypothetical protein